MLILKVANGPVLSEQAPARTPPGRERIVTNMTADDPTKPWIPTHLRQPSAFGAICRMADMTGMKLEELTTDGVSIPGIPRNRPVSPNIPRASAIQHQMPPPAPSPAVTTQDEDDPYGWMAAIVNGPDMSDFHVAPTATVAEPARVASYSEMDVDMADDSAPIVSPRTFHIGTLADSQWASTRNSTFQQSQPVSRGPLSSSVSGQPLNSFSNSTENVKPTAQNVPSQAPSQSNAPISTVLTRALAEQKPDKKLATLKDSRWA
ncbi:uncharacterized protein LY89DRAFT_475031 [Mollisia scopiformis]|uniref:Uncharacterized protein n=1 Tax=Mollisia scopiformis TaxID=149040 RepID=A0A194XFU2_MOLSC|nr:uncharacterized protein LY89DRAFT_475031 [Mollisia scopiformis]KUJ19038.1 hypothetical protein LY89DRAFT_475031 [Mollisia scopiformis]